MTSYVTSHDIIFAKKYSLTAFVTKFAMTQNAQKPIRLTMVYWS